MEEERAKGEHDKEGKEKVSRRARIGYAWRQRGGEGEKDLGGGREGVTEVAVTPPNSAPRSASGWGEVGERLPTDELYEVRARKIWRTRVFLRRICRVTYNQPDYMYCGHQQRNVTLADQRLRISGPHTSYSSMHALGIRASRGPTSRAAPVAKHKPCLVSCSSAAGGAGQQAASYLFLK